MYLSLFYFWLNGLAMSKISFSTIMEKYWDTIKEEINVKELSEIDKSINIKKTYKPLWNKLSSKFGKDTGRIIQFWKSWNMKEIWDDKIAIFDDEWNEWTLEKDDYEISYEWLEWTNMAIDWHIIASMDLVIDAELQREWVAREISRFLNQMRKDADYNVWDKVKLMFCTENEYLCEVLDVFKDFLCKEALLSGIERINRQPEWNIVANFSYDESNAIFSLTK